MPPALEEKPGRAAGSVVVIGNFDGVHLGHQAVVRAALAEAAENGLRARALTFHPHPQEVLGRGARPVLTRIERKLALLSRMGIDVDVERFTPELAQLSPREFATRVLVERLAARTVLVGENFRFGRDRSGDLAELTRLGADLGFDAHAVVLAGDADGLFSSTRVRAALAAGDLDSAERCLGRPHSVAGSVTRGDGRGRTIGVPTANLEDVVEVLPPNGVYACLVDREHEEPARNGTRTEGLPGERFMRGEKLAFGVANIGVRPTVSAGFSVEVHLLDFDGDLYGARLRVHWIARLRDELKFASLTALTEQIAKDVLAARDALTGRAPDPAALGAWA